MSVNEANLVLLGALTMSSLVAGLFFLRFWRTSRDRLFIFFAAAFWLLGFNCLGLAVTRSAGEVRPQIFLLRLAAFVLIIVGVIDKNRRARSRK